jgi:hypothetical protein
MPNKGPSREGHRGRLNLTPAQVEQLTAEYEDVEDMILALEEKGAPQFPLRLRDLISAPSQL